ncbi:MAG: LruC domain-containing protein [Bacteroidota bacterium]
MMWLLAVLAGCDIVQAPIEASAPEEAGLPVDVPAAFRFETVRPVDVVLTAQAGGEALAQVPVRVYDGRPDAGGRLLLSGQTDARGQFAALTSLPTRFDSVTVQTDYLGLPNEQAFAVRGGRVDASLQASSVASARVAPAAALALGKGNSYRTLGGWDGNGVPAYLEPQRDIVDAGLLAIINASLPERNPVPVAHPEYLRPGNVSDIRLRERADVWVTFVHEGAGWKNALGYYTYDLANPPQSTEDVGELTLIFPNTSYAGSGGGLRSGDKVKLGTFDAGTGIGWFLVANGWDARRSTVGNGSYTLYSEPDFNPETDPQLRQHSVLLYDAERELLILGYEDWRRDNGSDNDFNDAVFYASANPITAVDTEGLGEVDDPAEDPSQDYDGDGVRNGDDQFPYDRERAFESFQPARGVFGTLAFEDLWPSTGDYDFNDLVVDYNVGFVTNAANQVVDVRSTLVVRAIGAGYRNGFGFTLPISPSQVKSVTGQSITSNYVRLASNGTEQGQGKAVIIAFDDAYGVVKSARGAFMNTQSGAAYVEPDTVRATVTLASPMAASRLGTAPFNPFLIVDGQRGHEVHLPGNEPTDLVDQSLFGTKDDRTAGGLTYVTDANLPWALHVPATFVYPLEKRTLTAGHLKFAAWVESAGSQHPDWYLDRPGYRNRVSLYER